MKNLQDMIHDSTEVLTRPKDVSFALDQATEWNRSHPKLKDRLDLKHVGVLGHSFGAYTVLALAGARPALDWLEPEVAPGKGLGPDLSDKRILCGVALSPQSPGEPFFLPESFSTIKIPVLGISGPNDQQSNGNPPIQRREAFKLWPDMGGKSAFVWITDASHMDFSDSTGSDLKRRDSASRRDVQKVVREASRLFFDQCLKGNKEAGPAVTEAKFKPQLGGSVTRVEVLSK
jgi:predicted dienelactone hydrolase